MLKFTTLLFVCLCISCCRGLTGFPVFLLLWQVSHLLLQVSHFLHQWHKSTPDGEVTVTVYPSLLIQLYTRQNGEISARCIPYDGCVVNLKVWLAVWMKLNGTLPQCLIRSSWKSSSCSRMYSGQGHSCLSSLKFSSMLICRNMCRCDCYTSTVHYIFLMQLWNIPWMKPNHVSIWVLCENFQTKYRNLKQVIITGNWEREKISCWSTWREEKIKFLTEIWSDNIRKS